MQHEAKPASRLWTDETDRSSRPAPTDQLSGGQLLARPKVALFVESSRSYGRDLLRGIAHFARTRTKWSLLHPEMTLDAKLPEWIHSSAIDGVIGRVDLHTIDPLRKLNVPLVDVRCRHQFDNIPQVDTDDSIVSRMAFDHLWARGFRRFAFCGYQHAHYSETRLHHFRRLVESAGASLEIYTTPGQPEMSITSVEQSGVTDNEPMTAWLKSLRPPTGLFVCNDIRGQQVLNACASLNVSVPDDLGVIGVDDDDAICPLSNPPLSSVRPDAERVGFRAAEVLSELMAGQSFLRSPEYVQPMRVVQRLSTQVIAVEDRELSRVCRFIREHACDGIDVHDVAAFTTLSRRQLERRFRAELDRTPHEEITSVQIARVKELLSETDMTLEQISPLAGYSHKERLSAVFKRETRQTPGEYRRSQQ